MKKIISLVIITALFLSSLALPLYASEDNAATKLGRGLANVFTGWLEIPAEIGRQNEKKGELAAIFIGPILGFCKAVGRTAVGAYDTITFPIPLPSGYKPVIEPELVMEDDN